MRCSQAAFADIWARATRGAHPGRVNLVLVIEHACGCGREEAIAGA
ncbi:hypothetical protein ACWGQT_08815 [Streptomyces yangpuensis]